MQSIAIAPKDYPLVKKMLDSIGYRKHKAYIRVSENVIISGTYWDGGSRSTYTAFDIATGYQKNAPQFAPPQFGGPRVSPEVAIPNGVAVIEHGISCGKPATAFITLNAHTFSVLFPLLK